MLLLHPPIEPWLRRVADGLEVTLLIDLDRPQAVWLRALPDNEERLIAMEPGGRSGALHCWTALLPWDHGNQATLYCFKVLHGGRQHWLAADGLHPHTPPEAVQFRVARETPPEWVRDQVVYQVFPDRFDRAQPRRDRSGEVVYGASVRPVLQPEWGSVPDPAHAANSFYGGDLDGVVRRLDHLQRAVGATAVYLNPIFRASTNHRYDTEDYDHVDPNLGGDPALERLSHAMHARGMKLVLDAVVNHTGTNHPWFNRWGQHATLGAAQSPSSPWRSWYAFDAAGQPVGWKGHASLPVLDFSSPGVQQAVYGAPDAIVRRWLRPPYSIDGWRLDVIHMLGEGPGAHNNATHVRAMRRAIKQENPAAYMLGEHFSEATRWLQGDQHDGAMNYYGFAMPMWAWLAGHDVSGHAAQLDGTACAAWMDRARAAIPYEQQLAQLNLLGSHDTPRILTRLDGDTARVKLAFTMLFGHAGVPCVYYGDEVGLPGGQDPDCRRCMDWSEASWNRDLLGHVRALSELRSQRREWRDGAQLTLGSGEDWIAWARFRADAVSIIVANRGPALDVELPLSALPLSVDAWRTPQGDALPMRQGHLLLQVPAASAAIALAESPAR